MTGTHPSGGYTIIEVSLFLGISALLLLIAIFGTGNVIRANRFTDSSRSLHNYVQKKYDDLINGVNIKGTAASCNSGAIDVSGTQNPGTSNCLLMGKLLTLKRDANTVQTYDIIGTEPAVPNYNQSDEELIHDFQPTIVRSINVQTFQIPWGAIIFDSKQIGTPGTPAVDALAFIRSPRSTRIVTYTYREPAGSYPLTPFVNPSMNNQNTKANFCLRSADGFNADSRLAITGGEGQDSIQLSFDVATGDCNGN